jgi:hypothetical protein
MNVLQCSDMTSPGAEYDASEASTLKTCIYLSEFVLNPSAGIGYLVVFLLIQPEAWLELRNILGCPVKSSGAGGKGKRHKKRLARKDTGSQDNADDNGSNDDAGNGSSNRDVETYAGSGSHHSTQGSYRSGAKYSDHLSNNNNNDSDSDDGLEDEYSSMRETINTLSSNDSSLFPLLDNMTEDDLAREIERRYNPQYHSERLLNTPLIDDQKVPLIGSSYNIGGW